MQKTISLSVNGKPASATVEGRTLLVQLLREHLGLTGTHVGCDTSQCGACVVHVDGEAVKACTLLALQAEGRSVLTIEGVATGDTLHGRSLGELLKGAKSTDCRALCVGADGTVYFGETEAAGGGRRLLPGSTRDQRTSPSGGCPG